MSNQTYERDPFETIFRLQEDLSRAMAPRGLQAREHVSQRVWAPLVDVSETTDAIVIKADLPGMRQEDIDVELTGDTLILKGERLFEDVENKDSYIRRERQYGAFQRSFNIGVPIENKDVRATYRNGILELTLPKAETSKPRKVQVSIE